MKVGEYCRTKDGHIEKIIDRYKAPYGYKIVVNEDFKFKHYEHNYIKHIVKSSPNIIDLIEVGDYVNGLKITYIDEPDEYNSQRLLYFEYPIDYVIKTFCNEDIKSIVTREMFESIEYKVKE